MRFFKICSITVITVFMILAAIYSARLLIANHLIKSKFTEQQLNIEKISIEPIKMTCLDISLTNNMSIVINQLCIESAKADIEINDIKIQWQYSPEPQITDIDGKLINIIGKAHLFSNINTTYSSKQHNKYNQNLSQILSTTLQPYIKQITQLNLPKNININEISYTPFADNNVTKKSTIASSQQSVLPYSAQLLTVDNMYSFSLQNDEKIEFFNAKLTPAKDSFTIELSSELNLLKHFAVIHQLPISTSLKSDLSTNEINGNVKLLMKYKADDFSLQSHINELSINSPNGLGQSGAFSLSGALNFNSHFTLISQENAKRKAADKNNTEIVLNFIGENELLLEYSQPHLISLLEKKQLSPEVVSFIKENPLQYIKLIAKGNGTLSLNDQKGYLSHIEISAYNNELIHQVKLGNITINTAAGDEKNTEKSSLRGTTENTNNTDNTKVTQEAQTLYALAIEHFTIDSQLNLASVTKLTNTPLMFHIEGEVNTKEQKTTLRLTEQSSIKVKNIAVLTQALTPELTPALTPTSAPTEKKAKTAFSVKSLTTNLSGNIELLNDKDLNIDLTVHNNASQLNVPKMLKINSLSLLSQIKGNLDDINIYTSVNADDVYLGDITISGQVQAPKIKVAAEKLQLTELLSLNIQLPVNIALIDGTLTYSLSAELTDLSNIENTPFNASFSIKSLSGDIDKIWVQELNWQESLLLQAGKISTKPSIDKNFTVELIETFTPVSKISMNTDWAFNEDFTFSANQLNADIFSGNVSVPTIKWPFEDGHSANVQLNSIDLAQVLALDKKQGIVVTGNISGELPIVFDGKKYMIEQGELHNVSNGLIQVINNPAVESLKANNEQLQFAFDALQNLHYHQLSSEVSMTNDGYMQLDTVIKGHNPTIDNDVNLNLNISYDLLGLLESLSITQNFEDNLIKGLQKNKE